MRGLNKQTGDTIIEVMVSFVVFTMLAVGAISTMNRGVSTAQRALEITLVRQQIDSQADSLRYLHDIANTDGASSAPIGSVERQAYNDWTEISSFDASTTKDVSNFGIADDAFECPEISSDAFIMNARKGQLHRNVAVVPLQSAESAPYSKVSYTLTGSEIYPESIEQVSGIWIETKRIDPSQKYVDFHIRTCWYAADSNPITLGTIVRLYDD